jgi:hypothetical protein
MFNLELASIRKQPNTHTHVVCPLVMYESLEHDIHSTH